MKKYAFLTALAALMLCSCGDGTTVQQTPAAGLEEQTPPASEGDALYNEVYLWPEQEAYLPDTAEISITISNNTDEEIAFDAERFVLSRINANGAAEALPYKDGGDYFIELGTLVPAHESDVFTAKIAEHYDLPLAEGEYRIEISGMWTGFRISKDANEIAQPQTAALSMVTDKAEYPTGTDLIRVTVTNNSDDAVQISVSDFAIEKFEDGAVSMTPWSGGSAAPESAELLAGDTGDSYEFSLWVRDFPGLALTPGQYAVYLNGQEALFTVYDRQQSAESEQTEASEIVFMCEVETPNGELAADQWYDESFYSYSEIFFTRAGEIYQIDERCKPYEAEEMLAADTLPETISLIGTADPNEVTEQYDQIAKIVLENRIMIDHSEAEPAVAAPRYRWYVIVPNEQAGPQMEMIGEKFHTYTYPTDSETADAVTAWLAEQMGVTV